MAHHNFSLTQLISSSIYEKKHGEINHCASTHAEHGEISHCASTHAQHAEHDEISHCTSTHAQHAEHGEINLWVAICISSITSWR